MCCINIYTKNGCSVIGGKSVKSELMNSSLLKYESGNVYWCQNRYVCLVNQFRVRFNKKLKYVCVLLTYKKEHVTCTHKYTKSQDPYPATKFDIAK